jgi:ABC-2 type transport system ATP-binding protein
VSDSILPPLFQVRDLSKQFGRVAALSGATFSVRRNELLGLIGPNGAGKSTLFEIMGGVLPADRGAIEIDGRPVSSAERAALLFYLPDAIAPWSDQRVAWTIDFTIGFFGGRADLRDEVVRDLDIAPLLRQRLGTLSRGERKRVLLALGLLTPQPALLADEPFDGLDLRQMREVAAVLRRHVNRGRTLFLSIHHIGDAARLCDRFVLLSRGRVCGEGTVDELAAAATSGTTAPALEEVFLALT